MDLDVLCSDGLASGDDPLFFLVGGGEVADAYPLVVVKSDTARVSALHVCL